MTEDFNKTWQQLNETHQQTMLKDPFFIGFAVIFVLVFLVILFSIIRTFMMAGRISGKILGDGHKKVTTGQLKLIEHNYRELGVFTQPDKKMTRAEARDLLNEQREQLKPKK
ncbi:hypothetical protein FWC31_00805 [Candidatus Saccharibacteria bacterium]|nr:hypothetical protein [Candidatus Saccharibacteria bacterium]